MISHTPSDGTKQATSSSSSGGSLDCHRARSQRSGLRAMPWKRVCPGHSETNSACSRLHHSDSAAAQHGLRLILDLRALGLFDGIHGRFPDLLELVLDLLLDVLQNISGLF